MNLPDLHIDDQQGRTINGSIVHFSLLASAENKNSGFSCTTHPARLSDRDQALS
jgi:hypothetical protein